jgi:multidrug efflux pump subunit AcrB
MVVNVTVPCSDSPVREVDERIAPRLAAALGELPRAARVEISSVAGRCSAAIYFRPDSDSAAAMHGVRERLPAIVPKLPADCRDLLIGRGSADDLPLFWIALRGETLSLVEITEVANGLRDSLMRIPRAADVRTVGAMNRRLVLRLDSRRLAAFSATAGDVRRAFVNSFKADEFARRATLDPRELEDVVIRVRDGVPVRAKDVGRIEQAAIADGFAMIGAGASVLVAIFAEPGEIPAAAVEKELARLRTTLPADVRVSMAADLSRGRCCVAQAQLPLGATAEQMRRSAEQVAEAIRGMPGDPEAIVFSSGEGMFQALVPPGRHQITAPDLRQRLAGLPGVGIRICEVGGDVSLAAFPVRIGLVGPDPAVRRRWGNAVAARIRAEGHALDPEVFPGADAPGFKIELNREKAAALEVAAGDLAEAIHLATTSSITVAHGNGQSLEFRLEGASSIQDRLSILSVHNAAGELLPLARVVEARLVNEPSAIYRVGAEHAVRISAAPPPGTAVAQAVAKCVAAAGVERDELGLPQDYRIIDMTSAVE